jgi:SAM-dependent methyltransferase
MPVAAAAPGCNHGPVDSYARFAADYHWLLDDEQLTGRPFVAPYEHLLADLRPGSRVLDAACGIGVEALELARRQLDVSATDASHSMVAEARALALAERRQLDLAVCDWSHLAERFAEPFALVVCNGNSLVHANHPGEPALTGALRDLAAVLRADGRLVIGTRNFEHLRRTGPDVEVSEIALSRDGVHCVRFYSWQLPARWSERHRATVHLALVRGVTVDHRRYDVDFVPYTAIELEAAIAGAGLVIESSTRDDNQPRHTLVLRHRHRPDG